MKCFKKCILRASRTANKYVKFSILCNIETVFSVSEMEKALEAFCKTGPLSASSKSVAYWIKCYQNSSKIIVKLLIWQASSSILN